MHIALRDLCAIMHNRKQRKHAERAWPCLSMNHMEEIIMKLIHSIVMCYNYLAEDLAFARKNMPTAKEQTWVF